jgi:plasmid maintenance system antidote protein VapI
MLMTKCKPATIGEILVEEFMKPIGLTQGALADAMGGSTSCATIVAT